jgi:hypothetical protein
MVSSVAEALALAKSAPERNSARGAWASVNDSLHRLNAECKGRLYCAANARGCYVKLRTSARPANSPAIEIATEASI